MAESACCLMWCSVFWWEFNSVTFPAQSAVREKFAGQNMCGYTIIIVVVDDDVFSTLWGHPSYDSLSPNPALTSLTISKAFWHF